MFHAGDMFSTRKAEGEGAVVAIPVEDNAAGGKSDKPM